MAITKSAQKALRQNLKRKLLNDKQKRALREALKKFRELASQKKIEEAKTLLPNVYKLLDKAAKTNLIKKNNASRMKSRMAKLLGRQ